MNIVTSEITNIQKIQNDAFHHIQVDLPDQKIKNIQISIDHNKKYNIINEDDQID